MCTGNNKLFTSGNPHKKMSTNNKYRPVLNGPDYLPKYNYKSRESTDF